jgi:hypothetical protein
MQSELTNVAPGAGPRILPSRSSARDSGAATFSSGRSSTTTPPPSPRLDVPTPPELFPGEVSDVKQRPHLLRFGLPGNLYQIEC